LAKWLRMYQNSGLQTFVRKTRILKLVGMADLERLSPHIDDDFFFRDIGILVPAVGEQRARVVFHAGCIANVAFAELNRATVRLLAQNGVQVYIAPHQRCCGALQAHSGYREEARHLARRNIDAMLDGAQRYDAIVTNAAGCGSMLKDYHDLLGDDAVYAERARVFAGKVKDVTEFLAELGLREPPNKLNMKVTYQDPCHLAHAQRVRSAPRELLRAIGAEIIEMPHSDQCCGSAGTYNVTQNDLSMKILDEKMNDLSTVIPEIELVTTANVGCMLQLRAGMEKRGVHLPVKHVVEVVEECY
jgi:glycolate oxidase iron-sulfur subunit